MTYGYQHLIDPETYAEEIKRMKIYMEKSTAEFNAFMEEVKSGKFGQRVTASVHNRKSAASEHHKPGTVVGYKDGFVLVKFDHLDRPRLAKNGVSLEVNLTDKELEEMGKWRDYVEERRVRLSPAFYAANPDKR